jgi:peptidoglycan/xylan/chitin deacetylase (PgdA/CDA1 family)
MAGEVGSHTVTHKAMTTLTAAKVSQELINSKNALTSRGINGRCLLLAVRRLQQ